MQGLPPHQRQIGNLGEFLLFLCDFQIDVTKCSVLYANIGKTSRNTHGFAHPVASLALRRFFVVAGTFNLWSGQKVVYCNYNIEKRLVKRVILTETGESGSDLCVLWQW